MNGRAGGLLVCCFVLVLSAPAAGADRSSLGAIDSLVSPATGRSGEPSLAVAADGTVWMSWVEQSAAAAHRAPLATLMTARFSGGRWVAAPRVIRSDTLFVNWADPPVLAAMSREVAWIAYPWKHPTGAGYAYDLRVSFTTTGGAVWTKPVILNHDGKAAQHGFVSLAPSGEGVELLWLDGRKTRKPKPGHEAEGDMTVRAARLDAGGTLTREVELDARACDCCNTAAVAVPGGILAAYRDRDKNEVRDIVVSRLQDGAWTPPAPLHRDGWKINGCPVNGPALDSRRTAVAVAWFTMSGDQAQVLAAFSHDGGEHFGDPIAISTGDPLGRVDVALAGDGSALVSWLEAIGQDALLQVQRVSPSGALAEPVTIARVTASRGSGFPRMVLSADRAYFAWVDPKDSRLRTASARIP
jgi:hypothetical protein